MSGCLHIDGSFGEGGGQIVRTGLALAALLQQPVKIDNIRANRKQPGLKTQHLAGVLALAEITGAEVSGAGLHSTSLTFVPSTLKGGRYRFEISTAGAASLLFETILPALLFAPESSEVVITGGTHVPFSPPLDFLNGVFLPIIRKLGAEVVLDLEHWGFYPKGGGRVRARVSPCRTLKGLQLRERGLLKDLHLLAGLANLPEHITQREIRYIETALQRYREKIHSRTVSCRALSPGNFICLVADYTHTTAGFNILGKRGRPAEEVAEDVCRQFSRFDRTEATVDSHLADQIVLYLVLAKGESCFTTQEITSHLATNIGIIRKFLPGRINIDRDSGLVNIEGVNYSP